MLIVLSPAKKLNLINKNFSKSSTPKFINEAETLINTLRKYKPTKLSQLMNISPALANLNYERYLNWNVDHSISTSKTAIFAFDGEAYAGLDAASFSNKELEYAQKHLRILSGLYGILKPLDLIHAYRLEMGTKLKVPVRTPARQIHSGGEKARSGGGSKKNLYDFWGDKIGNEVNDILKNHKEKVLVNLASNEYFKVINAKKIQGEIITPIFKDFNNGHYKVVMVYAKKARGMMTAYILKNKIESIEDIKGFDDSGYCYNADASTKNEMVFLRG